MSPATSIMGSSRKQQSVLRFRPNRGKNISPNSAKQILLKELGEVCVYACVRGVCDACVGRERESARSSFRFIIVRMHVCLYMSMYDCMYCIYTYTCIYASVCALRRLL
jgi:hypothetical protein